MILPASMRRPTPTVIICWILLGATSAWAAAAPKAPSAAARDLPWKAGAAAVDITPDGPVWLAGYGARTRPSDGVAQKLHAKALAIEDAATGSVVVLVTLDLIGVPKPVRERVVAEVAARHRIEPAAILLNASHTHSGPAPYAYGVPDPFFAQKGEEYGQALGGKIIEVIGAALAKRAPARLDYTRARAGFAMNRRLPVGKEIRNSANPDGLVDHDVPVLRVNGADGKLMSVLFGYACHNTVTGFYQINGDYAGYAQEYLEAAHPGVVALFLTGAAGDQNPYPRHRSLEQSAQHGRTLANAVEAALGVTAPRALRGPLRSAFGSVNLPYAEVTRAELERRAAGTRGVEKTQAAEWLRKLAAGATLPASYPGPVQVVSFGSELTLIALPGEPTVEYSLRLKRELANERHAVWVAGYSNETLGYVGSRSVILGGGYEGATANLGRHPAAWSPEVEDRIVARVHELFGSLGRAPDSSRE